MAQTDAGAAKTRSLQLEGTNLCHEKFIFAVKCAALYVKWWQKLRKGKRLKEKW